MNKRYWTSYYCRPSAHRKSLICNLPISIPGVVHKTLQYLEAICDDRYTYQGVAHSLKKDARQRLGHSSRQTGNPSWRGRPVYILLPLMPEAWRSYLHHAAACRLVPFIWELVESNPNQVTSDSSPITWSFVDETRTLYPQRLFKNSRLIVSRPLYKMRKFFSVFIDF